MNIENNNQKNKNQPKTDKKSFYLLLLFAGVVAVLIAGFVVYEKIVQEQEEQERITQEQAYKEQEITLPNFTKMSSQRKIGNNSARVKLYVISSFNCIPCGDFYNDILPSIISEFVDKKKLQIIFYDMITDGASMDAAMLSRCIDNDDTYFKFSESLYNSQIHWQNTPNTKKTLGGYAKIAGLNQPSIEACFDNKKLYARIIKQSNDIKEKYSIDSVPSFVLVRGKRYVVVKSYSELITAIKNF